MAGIGAAGFYKRLREVLQAIENKEGERPNGLEIIRRVEAKGRKLGRSSVQRYLNDVTPLILERLLGHYSFVAAGDVPSNHPVRCVLWKHSRASTDPRFARFRLVVYHYEVVAQRRVKVALALIEEVRMFERRIAFDGGIE